MRMRYTFAAALLVLAGCREGAVLFTPVEREYEGAIYAITFGAGNDTDPHWSPGGDSLLYHTDVFGMLPQSQGVLLRISPDGGSAAAIIPAQSTFSRALATPAYSPAGTRVAYFDLISVDPPGACGPEACARNQPLLDSAMLRVRPVNELGPITLDPSLSVKFAGTDPEHRFASDGPYLERLFPFQARHRAEGAMLFRPSWAPDGDRLAFSDGLALYVWDVTSAAATQVPGTSDGAAAAWSPDGEWIAFTHLARTDSVIVDCVCGGERAIPTTRWTYTTAEPMIVIVRPDGSDRREIGVGEDAAWSPDNQYIYARRNDAIVRIDVGTGDAVTIPGTERGRAPAISPDGTRMAFARRKDLLNIVDYDIWVASLVQ